MKVFVRFATLVLFSTLFFASAFSTQAQLSNSVAITMNCNSFTVQVTSRSNEAATVSVNVLNESQTTNFVGDSFAAPATFSVNAGGIAQRTFSFPMQPNNTLLWYYVSVDNSQGQIAYRADTASCQQFPPGTRVNDLDGVRPIAVFCSATGSVQVVRVDPRSGQGVETLVVTPGQLAVAIVNAARTGANQPAASTASGISLWALTSGELQAVYRGFDGNYDFIFPVGLCGGIDLSSVASIPSAAPQPVTSVPNTTTVLVPVQIPAQTVFVPAQPVTVASACVPQSGYRAHVIQRGQTLFSIGRAYGVDFRTIASVNGIFNPDRIFEGQCLLIP
jgi:hypothetical protein